MFVSLAQNRLSRAHQRALDLGADEALCKTLFRLPRLLFIRLLRKQKNDGGEQLYAAFEAAMAETEGLLADRAELLDGPINSEPAAAAA